jgi:hypothetical protein
VVEASELVALLEWISGPPGSGVFSAVVLAAAGKLVVPTAHTVAVTVRAAVASNRFERISAPFDMVTKP